MSKPAGIKMTEELLTKARIHFTKLDDVFKSSLSSRLGVSLVNHVDALDTEIEQLRGELRAAKADTKLLDKLLVHRHIEM